MDLAEYKSRFADPATAVPGWDAIDAPLDRLYPGQKPLHWATTNKYMLGGPDPLDGISIYESRAGNVPHLHFCTYGYSELYYDEDAFGKEFSKFGFEMTFRLAAPLPSPEPPTWVASMLQNLARYVFKSGRWFEAYHWVPANGPIRLGAETDIVGLVFAPDPELPAVDTMHGRVEFLQAFGITNRELDAIRTGETTPRQVIEQNQQGNPLLVTDLARRSASP